MPSRTRARGPADTSPVLSLLLAATVAFSAMLALWDAGRPGEAAEVSRADTGGADGWVDHAAADPVAVRSDAVDIESPTVPLGKRDDGSLEVPEDAHTVGWWTGRANPGERGPAVIVGHVDSRDGPGAFWELPDLVEGDRVTVDREDGSSLHWRVQRTEQHPKDAFPTDAVYGDTDEPTLRLITCSGFFDPEARSYEDNTIVFLELDEEEQHHPAPRAVPVSETADRRDEAAANDAPATVEEVVTEDTAAADGRAVPISLAVVSLLLASAAVTRELRTDRRIAVGPDPAASRAARRAEPTLGATRR